MAYFGGRGGHKRGGFSGGGRDMSMGSSYGLPGESLHETLNRKAAEAKVSMGGSTATKYGDIARATGAQGEASFAQPSAAQPSAAQPSAAQPSAVQLSLMQPQGGMDLNTQLMGNRQDYLADTANMSNRIQSNVMDQYAGPLASTEQIDLSQYNGMGGTDPFNLALQGLDIRI